MQLNEKLFFPKKIVCPVCEKLFTRYTLKKTQFSIDKRDADYRPLYLGNLNPRLFAICVCPNCYYSGEDRFFCPVMTEDDLRRKQYFDTHKAQWEAHGRVKAASAGQQVWKDQASEKLKELSAAESSILRKISPLLTKSAANIIAKGRPANELQKEADLDVAVRSYELAAICYKARRANHRILGYTYLNGAWTSRDAAEMTEDPAKKSDYHEFEMAFLKEAAYFLTITNKATSIEDQYMPDGTKIPKENLPETRIYEIMYVLAGVHYLLGEVEETYKYLEQIIYGSQNAHGTMLWFVNQAKELRLEISSKVAAEEAASEVDQEDNEGDHD